ncbi:MAG: formate dehydrogenase accessory sulfurtransferase FdhD [Actinobacteria bacterium]|nr:formate dehydrogenase accessory sulfurtransferase FdhD [Actinomycetota bacterium]
MTTTANRPGSTVSVRTTVVRDGATKERTDRVATEEPLEIRIARYGAPAIPLAVTMRTPGNDFELAVGLLVSEGVVTRPDDVLEVRYCVDGEQLYNVVTVDVRTSVEINRQHLARNLTMTSACGVCGKAALDAIATTNVPHIAAGPVVRPDVIAKLPDRLREDQRIFDKTGGLHAAGLASPEGNLVEVREDVGRHNAVDKVIGALYMEKALPASDRVLVVSGRASFEIMQKAAAAGIPIVAAVGAPSSLAVDVAKTFGMTLAGFVRGGGFNIYTGKERVVL